MQHLDIEDIVRRAVKEFIATGEPERIGVERIRQLEEELKRANATVKALQDELILSTCGGRI